MNEKANRDQVIELPSEGPGARVAKNTIVLIVLRLVVPILSLALISTLSRMLGAEGLGRYTLAFSFLTLLGGLAPLGLPTVITRDGANDPNTLNNMLRNAMSCGAIASVLMTVTMIAAGSLLNYDAKTRSALVILSIAIAPYTAGMLIDGAIVALEKMQYLAAATLAEYLLKVAVAMVLLWLGFGLNAVLLTAVLGKVVGCLTSIFLLRRSGVSVGFSIDPSMLRKLGRLAPTFLLTTIFSTLYWRIDVLILSKLANTADLGYYGAAYRLFEIATVFPQSLCLSLYPQISAAVETNRDRLGRLGQSAWRYLLVVGLPAATFATLLPAPILRLLYGAEFDAAAPTLSVLMWTIIPYSLVRYNAYVLVAANQQRVDLLLNLVMSVINVAINFVLIPRYSHLGAATATLASMCALVILQHACLRRFLPGQVAAIPVQPVVYWAVGGSALCAWLMRDLSILIVLTVASFLYIAILFIGGFFTGAELKFLRIPRFLRMLGLETKELP